MPWHLLTRYGTRHDLSFSSDILQNLSSLCMALGEHCELTPPSIDPGLGISIRQGSGFERSGIDFQVGDIAEHRGFFYNRRDQSPPPGISAMGDVELHFLISGAVNALSRNEADTVAWTRTFLMSIVFICPLSVQQAMWRTGHIRT